MILKTPWSISVKRTGKWNIETSMHSEQLWIIDEDGHRIFDLSISDENCKLAQFICDAVNEKASK